MDIIVTATIAGKPHGLQFHSAYVSQSLFSPCEIGLELGFGEVKTQTIFDHDKTIFNKAVSDWLGEELVLIVQDKIDTAIQKKFTGIIENIYLESGGISIRAISKDGTLNSAEKHRSFADKRAFDIASDIVNNSGLNAQLTGPSSSIEFKFLHQYDETDYEFMKRLARYDGCVFYHDGETFVYTPKLSGTQNVSLGVENLTSVRLNCFLGGTKFHGVPYDYTNHNNPQNVVVDSSTYQPPSHPFLSKVYNKSDQLRSEPIEIFNEPIPVKNDFTQFVKNQQAFYAGSHVIVNGQTNHPMVSIGRTITCSTHPILTDTFVITNLEARFDGNVYSAEFTGIVKDSVIRSLQVDEREYMGLMQPAIVLDNADPDKLGRVQIQYLWDVDNNAHAWARVVSIGAGVDHGTHFTPRVGDQVLVGCEHGNTSLPIVLGALYHSDNKPDFTTDNGSEEVLLTKTPAGSEIRVVDKQGSEEILLSMPGGKNIIKMELSGPKITIESLNGTISIHSKEIEIKADQKITMNAQEIEVNAMNKLALGSSNQAEFQATTSLKVSSTQVESSAAGTNVIKGAIVQIN